ncbi:MAG: hypothetical protein C5B50_25655 [Verrucomicrobia bacterium]|nr:MAG: hypothetical protein C5B50_25655 [Verrucomicrobiota bacterium]
MKPLLLRNYWNAVRKFFTALVLCALALVRNNAHASIAYGSINNFDTVNDTSNVCHGFEIELDDCRSQDITYCFSYNHYGTPSIRQDTVTVPGHTNCFVRYAAVYSNGVWSAYTAIPPGPIAPTLGHSFVNPGTNFGGEHFGVGFYGAPSALKYNWLLDDGAGNLIYGPPVLVSTPVFAYYPPAPAVPPQVQAVIEPPQVEVQAQPVEGFGPASWVKSIKTAIHTNIVIQLRQLVSDDPAFPGDKTWRNGEASEVESEFDLLQQEYGTSHHGTAPAVLAVTNAPEALPVGDEIITRRYEFYSYVGPTDPTTHAALAKKVGPDGIHGINQYSNTVVVGDYLGAQMAAYKHELPIGLTENIADGRINSVYPTRTIVIAGVPFTCTNIGTVPPGLTFDTTLGQLSGTPSQAGIYTFKVRVTSTNQVTLEHAYTLAILGANQALPPHSTVDTVTYPLDSGDTTGLGLYTNTDNCTVTATSRPGYRFSNWTDNDAVVSTNAAYQFPVSLNRSLVANFVPAPPNLRMTSYSVTSHSVEWPTNATSCVLQVNTDLYSTNWATVAAPVSIVGTNAHVDMPTQPGARFYRLKLQ